MSFLSFFRSIFNPAPTMSTQHTVTASSFADPADVRRFLQKKAEGMSDLQAMKYGDNGVGVWGDNTKEGSGPACALPPEDWHTVAHPRKAKVRIYPPGRPPFIAELRDTMPHRENIKNGAGIDLNPDAVKLCGKTPPMMLAGVRWEWA